MNLLRVKSFYICKKLSNIILYALLICSALFLTHNSKAQSAEELEERRGFKEFELGDSYSEWESDIERLGKTDQGYLGYKYVGECCQSVFDWEVQQLWLGFSDKRLVSIRIFTDPFSSGKCSEDPFNIEDPVDMKNSNNEFNSLKSSLSALFGEPTYSWSNEEGKAIVVHAWESESVLLALKQMYFGICESSLASIQVREKDFFNKELNDGF
jgi:hypothetical protein